MSLHSETREYDAKNGWRTICVCGWEGTWHDARRGTDGCHRDYREHVEDALGAAAYYDANVACRNCGSEHSQGVVVGTHVTAAACARCGTVMLSPRNEAWDEAQSKFGWLR